MSCDRSTGTNDVRRRSEGACETNQEAGRKHQVPLDGPVGPIVPGSSKSFGSSQHLRDNETRKQRIGATRIYQGPTLQCTRPQICAVINSSG